MAKEFLSRSNIHFKERNIHEDPAAMRELQQRNISGVPTFFIGSDVVIGLDKERVLKLVDHRLVQCESCGQNLRVPTGKGNIQVTCPKCSHKFSVST